MVSCFRRMRTLRTIVILAMLCGCPHDPPTRPASTSAGPIDQAEAISIAQQLVTHREKWEQVDCESRRGNTDRKLFVCPKPIKIVGPVVFITLDQSGKLISYGRSYNSE